MSLYEDLCTAAKTKLADGEEFAAFVKRAVAKINKLSDKDWDALPPELQSWVNASMKAIEQTDDLPELEGFPEAEAPEEGEAEAEEGSEEATEEVAGEGEAEAEEAGESGEEGQGEAESAEGEEGGAETPPTPKAKVAAKKPKAAPVKKAAGPKAKAPAKAKVAAKPAKAAAKPGKKGRHGNFGDAATIKIVAKENPHRKGTICYNYFAKYKEGMTVAKAVSAGVPLSNIRYLVGLGHIKVLSA